MKLNYKNIFITVLITGCMCFFVLYPFSCGDLHLKIYLNEDSAYTTCSVYYTTVQDPVFHDGQRIDADTESGYADLIIPKEYCGQLTGLRLDFTPADALIGIKRVELCSGGFVRQSLDASDFFTEAAASVTNDIQTLQAVQNVVYIQTSGSDPHIYFDAHTINICQEAFSHYTGSKLAICLFLLTFWFLYRKPLFTAKD